MEVVGEREKGRARGRQARGEGATSSLVCLLLARPFFLEPTKKESARGITNSNGYQQLNLTSGPILAVLILSNGYRKNLLSFRLARRNIIYIFKAKRNQSLISGYQQLTLVL